MRLLFLLKEFRQGWGGAPESVRLMANYLCQCGMAADVTDSGFICRDVGRLNMLPSGGELAERFKLEETPDYDAILITGPWQNPLGLRRVLAKRRRDQPMYYLPRGGLARIEFRWPRGPKKVPYFVAVERRFLQAASGIVFSSTAEQKKTVAAAHWLRRPEYIIPDFVSASVAGAPRERTGREGVVIFGFLAEISRRKGLLPFVTAFVQWVQESGLRDRVRLVIGGGTRPGADGYLKKVMRVLGAGGQLDVEIRGPVAHGDRDRFYDELDVMVVPSLFESYGLTVIEALTAGCVLLVTPDVGILEVIPENASVRVAAGADVQSIKSGVNEAYRAAMRAREGSGANNMEFRAEVVDRINRTALDAWSRLLRGGDSSQAAGR